MDFGDSELETHGSHLGFIYKQCFNIAKYITMSAINLFGRDTINRMLPYWTEDYLNQQIIHKNISLPQLDREGSYNVNWRMTADPLIHNHVLDLEFFFDIGAGKNHCFLAHDTHDYLF